MLLRSLLTFILIFSSSKLLAFDEAKVARSLGLELVSEGHPYNFFGVNSVYVNDDMSRQMLVVSRVEGTLKEPRVFHHKGFLIYEIPKSSDSYASIALVGIKEEEIKDKIKSTSIWLKVWDEFKPIRRVYSEDCDPSSAMKLEGISNLATHFGSSVWKSTLSCLNNMNQGIREATLGRAESFKEGLILLAQDPRAFWEKKVQELKNIKDFINHFDVKIKQMSAALAKLSPDIIAKFMCGFIGSLGVDALVTMISGGMGAGALLFKLEEFVARLIKLEKAFTVLDKVGKLRTVPPNFLERLSTGKVPDVTVNSMLVLADHNFPDFIQGLMKCSL